MNRHANRHERRSHNTSPLYRKGTVQEVLGEEMTHLLFTDNDEVPPDFKSRDNYFEDDGNGVSVVLMETCEGPIEREE